MRLRTPIADYEDLLLATFIERQGTREWIEMAHLFEARYRLGPVEIAVDVRSGQVFKVTAHEGYRGSLPDGIHIGMTVAGAQQIDPRLYYDEGEALLLIHGHDGITLNIPEDDPDPATVPAIRINAISVFAPELWLDILA